jgi:hypothetical protein
MRSVSPDGALISFLFTQPRRYQQAAAKSAKHAKVIGVHKEGQDGSWAGICNSYEMA